MGTMRQTIIISAAAAVLMAGAATYGLVVDFAPRLIGGTTTSAVEATKLEEALPFAAADDAPRTPIGHLIANPTPEPEITTGSVNPTAKPSPGAKAAKARKQARKPKLAARKQAQPQPDSPTAAPTTMTMAHPSISVAD